MKREAGRTFDGGVGDADIRNQLLLGDLQAGPQYAACVPSSWTPENKHWDILQESPPPTEQKDNRQPMCWCCGRPGHFQGNCPSKTEGNDERRLRRDNVGSWNAEAACGYRVGVPRGLCSPRTGYSRTERPVCWQCENAFSELYPAFKRNKCLLDGLL